MDKELLNVSVEAGKLIAKESYEDAIQPTAKAVGQLASLPIRVINAFLEPCYKYVIESEKRLDDISKEVYKKLEGTPEEKIVIPEKYVAIPAMQQYCYSANSNELRDMYANLLAASMNTDTKNLVMPSYVNIIGQLTPDEAKLLQYIVKENGIIAIEVHLITDSIKHHFNLLDKYYFKYPDGLLYVSENIKVYLDNLMRLKLVECPTDMYRIDEEAYSELEEEYKDANKGRVDVKNLEFTKRTVYVTELGYAFSTICLE